MIKVTFFVANGGILGFEAKGHSGYAEYGKDIICSAISALTQTAVIGFKKVLKIDVNLSVTDGYLKCTLLNIESGKLWQQSQLIFKVLKAGLGAIQEEYGEKYLHIEEVDSCE